MIQRLSQPRFPDTAYPHIWKSRHGIYYFRVALPKSQTALAANGRRSLKRSLKTRCPKEALIKAQTLWALHFGDKEAVSMALANTNSSRRLSDSRLTTNYSKDQPALGHDMSTLPSSVPTTTSEAPPTHLSQIIELFLREGRSGNNWDQKTALQHSSTLKILIDGIGDKPINQVSRSDLIALREELKMRPRNLNKRKHLIKLDDCASMAAEPKLAVGTVNNIITRIHTFFSWAQRNDYSERNPAQRLKLKDEVHPRDKRAAYSVADLQALLDGYNKYRTARPHSYQYWLPLLGMYTGARLEELCQLYVTDVVSVRGIWCISINNDGEKKVKTRSSLRLIPVHSALLDIGFLDFVEECRGLGKRRLFSELPRKRDGYHPLASKWFNEKFKRRCKLSPGKKDFHSFRHTVADYLKQKGLSKEKVAALLGHCDGSETFDRYGKAYSPEGMKSVVESLDYPILFIITTS